MSAGRALAALSVLAAAGALVAAQRSAIGLAAGAAPSPAGTGELVYSNLPRDSAGLPVVAFESYSTSEFGGEVQLAGNARKNPVVSFLLASYACQKGRAAACSTQPGASFRWPLTLEVWSAGQGESTGQRLVHTTLAFSIPYRPSARRGCPHEGWTQGFGPRCSFAQMHEVSFSLPGVTLPDTVVLGLGFNTEDYGGEPAGRPGPYNLLGVAVDGDYVCSRPSGHGGLCQAGGYQNVSRAEPRVGSDPLSTQAFVNTTYEPLTCGGSAGSFGATGACWSHEQPVVEVRAAGP